jgi:hypothetical protein
MNYDHFKLAIATYEYKLFINHTHRSSLLYHHQYMYFNSSYVGIVVQHYRPVNSSAMAAKGGANLLLLASIPTVDIISMQPH